MDVSACPHVHSQFGLFSTPTSYCVIVTEVTCFYHVDQPNLQVELVLELQ